MYLASNLKILRRRKNFTQNLVSNSLSINRSTYNGYENEVAYPSLDRLIKISDFFNINIDVLLRFDLSKLNDSEFRQLEFGSEAFIKGGNLRILTHTVDSNNRENIELVNLKAKAGYSTGYADPEFIRVLPTFQLPFLSKDKKYRGFQISGDSMEPIPHGSYVIGEFVQNWYSLKDGEACIILTMDEGIVFKCIENKLKSRKKLGLFSLNSTYSPYTIDAGDIKEIWKFVYYISGKFPEEFDPNIQIHKEIVKINEELSEIRKKLP